MDTYTFIGFHLLMSMSFLVYIHGSCHPCSGSGQSVHTCQCAHCKTCCYFVVIVFLIYGSYGSHLFLCVFSPGHYIFCCSCLCIHQFHCIQLLMVWLMLYARSPPSSRVTLASCHLVTNMTAVDTSLIGKCQGKDILDPNK